MKQLITKFHEVDWKMNFLVSGLFVSIVGWRFFQFAGLIVGYAIIDIAVSYIIEKLFKNDEK